MIRKVQGSVVVVWVTIIDHCYCWSCWLQTNYESGHHRNDDVVVAAAAAVVVVAYALHKMTYTMACL